jgi:hypothetical protein
MIMAKPMYALIPCCAIALSLASAGCMRLSARAAPEPPPLDMPLPPPRVIETAASNPPTPGTLVDAPAGGAPSSRRPPPRVEAPKPAEASKPEPPPPVAEVPQPPQEPARTPPLTTLQTTPPEREAALEKEIRGMLERAASNLNRVDYRKLNVDAKAQYDQAKNFAVRAEDSLRSPSKNLVFAQQLAKNALDMAVQLAGR